MTVATAEQTPLDLYGFWRSQATFRLRVALNLKGVRYHEHPINLDGGEQGAPDFLKLNPLGSVPVLMVDGQPLTQSLAVLEYLEERFPTPPLLPADAYGRWRVRSLAGIAVSDSHPLIVPRVKRYLVEHAQFTPASWKAWQTHWFSAALKSWEKRLASEKDTGRFCHGDVITFADICLVGLVAGTQAFAIEVPGIPTIQRIVEACRAEPAFDAARAENQADFPS